MELESQEKAVFDKLSTYRRRLHQSSFIDINRQGISKRISTVFEFSCQN